MNKFKNCIQQQMQIITHKQLKLMQQTNLPLEYFGACRQMFLLPAGRL